MTGVLSRHGINAADLFFLLFVCLLDKHPHNNYHAATAYA